MNDTILVIRKEPDRPPELAEIENSDEAIMEALGGYMDAVIFEDDHLILYDEEGWLKGKLPNCRINGMRFVGTILIAGMGEDGLEDVQRVDEILYRAFHIIRYGRSDRRHNVWACRRCGHLEQFETDGPFENGWNYCPHCGGVLLAPRAEQEE